MTRQDYLDDLKNRLTFLPKDEREDFVLEFGSHIDSVSEKNPETPIEDLIARLPSPASIASQLRAESRPQENGGGDEDESRGSRRSGSFWEGFGKLSDFFKSADFNMSHEDSDDDMEGELPDVQRIRIRSLSADITVKRGEKLRYRAHGHWRKEMAPVLELEGGRLEIKLDNHVDHLELEVPPSLVELDVGTLSGDVECSLPVGSAVRVKTASGDVGLNVNEAAVSVESASGDINVRGGRADVRVNTASGDVHVDTSSGDMALATASGDIYAKTDDPESNLALDAISGDLDVILPSGSTHGVLAKSVSGDVDLRGFPGTPRRNRNAYEIEGGPGLVKAVSHSGDVNVNKNS